MKFTYTVHRPLTPIEQLAYEANTIEEELTVEYSIFGKYYRGSYFSPPESPELEIVSITNCNGEEVIHDDLIDAVWNDITDSAWNDYSRVQEEASWNGDY